MMSSSSTLGVPEPPTANVDEATIRARRDFLSLDLQSPDLFTAYATLSAQIQKSAATTPVESNPLYSFMASTLKPAPPPPPPQPPAEDVTAAQKHYTKGFFDALRCVQLKNGQDPEQLQAAAAIQSPQAILNYFSGRPELMSPTAITPTAPSDLHVILKSIAAQTPLHSGLTPITRPNCLSPLSMPAFGSSTLSTPTSSSVSSTSFPSMNRPEVLNLKKEASEEPTPETSDRSRCSSAAPSTSRGNKTNEVNMDEQDRRKLERKRARNRVAASKCRQKKMDKITELEGMVREEKMRGSTLDDELSRLHSSLQQLQALMNAHCQRGCPGRL